MGFHADWWPVVRLNDSGPLRLGPTLRVGDATRAIAAGIGVPVAIVSLLLMAPIAGASADVLHSDPPFVEYRPAQEAELDFTVDFDALQDGAETGANARSKRYPRTRVDWSRRVGKSWELDPVLLHRRQAGQPDRPDDDLSNKMLGIEFRRRF